MHTGCHGSSEYTMMENNHGAVFVLLAGKRACDVAVFTGPGHQQRGNNGIFTATLAGLEQVA